jgi:hypothetical protein
MGKETIRVEWTDGPRKGQQETLVIVWGGYQRTEKDGSLTYIPGSFLTGKQPKFHRVDDPRGFGIICTS